MSSSNRRGRPPGQVRDLPAVEGRAFSAEARIGWLLRTWRLSRLPDSGARGFAGLLAASGVPADPSRVSRWETGQLTVPFDVVEAYEQILGLPRGGLPGLAAALRRVASGGAVPPLVYSPARVRPDVVERLLDVVVDGDPVAQDWFDLGMTVATLGESLVLPRSLWRDIARRLLREMGVSVGPAYLGRSEAILLLTSHSSALRSIVHAVGEYVTDPDSAIVVDPMSMLQEIPGAQANDLVLRLLADGAGPVRWAAAWVAGGKVVRGHFDAEEMRRLERIVVELVRAEGLHGGAVLNRLVDLVEVLPAPARDRVVAHARAHGASGAPTRDAAVAAPTVPAEAVRQVVRQVMGGDRCGEDPMLERLLTDALLDKDLERRFLAALAIAVSPAREQVATGAAAAVATAVADPGALPGGQLVLHRLLTMLTAAGGPAQRELLVRLVGDDQPSAVRSLALAALAHLEPVPDGPVSDSGPDLAALVTCPDDAVADRALYCAGMTGDPCLERLAVDTRLPDRRRRGARWWLANGGSIHGERGPAVLSPEGDASVG